MALPSRHVSVSWNLAVFLVPLIVAVPFQHAAGQALRSALEKIPAEKRGVRPDSVVRGIGGRPGWKYGTCGPVTLPDTLVLVSPGSGRAALYATWQRWASDPNSFWGIFTAPDGPDTLRVRVVDMNCDHSIQASQTPSLLLEHDSVFFSLSTNYLVNSNDSYPGLGSDRFDRVYAFTTLPDGTLEPAVFFRDQPVAIMGLAAGLRRGDEQIAAIAAADEAKVRAKRWPPEITKAVLAGEISVGMTAEMVRLSWGDPKSINTTVTAQGTSEQWVYGSTHYAYLTNGIVTVIQTSQ